MQENSELSNGTANYLQTQGIQCMSGLIHQVNRMKAMNPKVPHNQ